MRTPPVRPGALALAVLVLPFTLVACASNETPVETPSSSGSGAASSTSPALTGTLNAGGASAQTAAQEAWRAGFQSAHAGVTVNYDPTGSGTGRTNFTDGGYAVAGTDAAFSVEAAEGPFAACAAGSALVEVPAYISPIAVGFNLPGLTTVNLDAATIAGIFTGAITSWDDAAITAQNPGAELPQTTITVVHRGDKSGTTENFTDYLAAVASTVWTHGAAETWPTELTGESADKTQGMREAISSTTGAIGYIDASQATDMGQVAIKVGDEYVGPTAEGAAAAVGQSSVEAGRAATDVVIEIDRNLTDPDTYPLVLVSYLAACEEYADADQGALVKAFLAYAVSSAGQEAAADNAGSAPITSDPTLTARVQAAVEAIR